MTSITVHGKALVFTNDLCDPSCECCVAPFSENPVCTLRSFDPISSLVRTVHCHFEERRELERMGQRSLL